MKIKWMLVLVALAALASLGMAGIRHQPMMQNCLMHAKDVETILEDTADGVAITFTTQAGDTARLREHVEKMAKTHEEDSSPAMNCIKVSFTATYEEVSNGARLTFKPKDPAKLEELRAAAKKHLLMKDMMREMMTRNR